MSLSIGGSSKSTSGKTTATPNATATGLYDPNYNAATTDFTQPYTAYGQPMTSGLTPDQLQAMNMAQGGLGTGQAAVSSGVQGAQGLIGYNPQQVGAQQVASPNIPQTAQAGASTVDRSQIGNVGSGQLNASRINELQNPYQQSVIDTTNADLDRQRQIALNQQSGDFTKAGAWGGSRQGVADGATNEAYGRIMAQTDAGLRQQGYDTAAGLAQGEATRAQAAQGQNQQADLSTAGQNASLGTQVGLANAGAQNQMGQFGAQLGTQVGLANAGNNLTAQQSNQQAGLAGGQLSLGASGLAGQLGQQQQSMGLADVNSINTLGAQDQATQNAAYQAAYQEWLRGQNLPLQQGAALTGLLGTIPAAFTGATQTSTGKTSGYGFGASASYGGGGGGS